MKDGIKNKNGRRKTKIFLAWKKHAVNAKAYEVKWIAVS
jgi:hypothetical protein